MSLSGAGIDWPKPTWSSLAGYLPSETRGLPSSSSSSSSSLVQTISRPATQQGCRLPHAICVVWVCNRVAPSCLQGLGEREGRHAEGAERETGRQRAGGPQTPPGEELEPRDSSETEEQKSEVMIAKERPASIQAIKMSHELPEDHPSELEGWCW